MYENFFRITFKYYRTKILHGFQENLSHSDNQCLLPTDGLKHVQNLSSTQSTRAQLVVIFIRVKFKISPKSLDRLQTQVQCENLYDQLKNPNTTSQDNEGWFCAKTWNKTLEHFAHVYSRHIHSMNAIIPGLSVFCRKAKIAPILWNVDQYEGIYGLLSKVPEYFRREALQSLPTYFYRLVNQT
ncbi:hypothetical protein EG68_05969 [Paragonimus skrjabini miyazakii]|uniref:Uncharacterized protein n=1 Tax=Paragonimus skrjabini miyazakii TaxID=59628 RepID=A0A8S9YW86_9TREM|nr:hypothetical protein EG68_05969 [Paragonimus skrjabini miyazakii]